MNTKTKKAGWAIVFALVVIGCHQDEELQPLKNQDENQSEIALLEKELGITFYKEDLKLIDETGRNVVTLQVAGKTKAMVDAYLEMYEFSISPIFRGQYEPNPAVTAPSPVDNSVDGEANIEGIFTEVISKQLDKDVIGLRTTLKLKNRSLQGRVAAPGDFPSSATHYNTSGNWPEIFKMYASSTVGYQFMGKSRWYSGWSTRTFCDYYNSSVCASYWEHGGEQWTSVDGPYDVRVTVYYFQYWDYSFEWINY